MPNEQPQPKSSNNPQADRKARMTELLSKVALVRDGLMRRGQLVNEDPAKVYQWVNVKEARQTYFQAWGWELVKDDRVQSPFKKSDKIHQRADLILYQIDREMWEAIQASNQLRGLEGIESHKNAAIAAFHRHGVREFTPDV